MGLASIEIVNAEMMESNREIIELLKEMLKE